MVIFKNKVPVFMKRCITLKKLNADWCHYMQFHLSPFILIPCDMTHQKQLSTESELSWHKKKNIAGVVRKHRWWLTYRSIFLCRNKASLLFQDFFFSLKSLSTSVFTAVRTFKSLSAAVCTTFHTQIFVHDCFFIHSFAKVYLQTRSAVCSSESPLSTFVCCF